ncbi:MULTISPECIES: non-reducing end alpha-L-arabinofuranosidase family hydrolase [Streptomyces]|uniref:non-reducing end alpha-L-arabinofuranosidase n=1 Tax=Streptomyces lycii TaxID=2654337 RepID=A0ABQ7FQ50_9ACTN|nr:MULTISPECIES: non-reducing end alpha-L-arabinofuranosidase family hydrolase [Streptomyces]KAF4410113.1 glycoside hydrolase [Streptomyces lycii]PGH47035.1 glycoside hydrolase [Streptomyces sp. Ru87]
MRLTPRRIRRGPLRAAYALLLGLVLTIPLATAQSSATPADDRSAAAELPSSYQWSSGGPVISPRNGGDVSVKDPTVVREDDGTWHVFMTTADTAGDWSLTHTSFSDWSQAADARQTPLETSSGIGTGYRAAPHAFYFAPKDEWYLVYQTGLPSYSTSKDPGDPSSWSAPKNFQDSMPDIVRQNIGNGHWLDYWVICDDTMCYLYSADDNGHLYRAETTVGEFPNGFRNTKIDLQDSKNNLFEGEAVYKVQGTNTYLLIMEAIGSDGRRWYRSFTSEGLNGQWRALADTESNPFARSNNVTFPGGAWTRDISHGELVRTGPDQTMTIDPCDLQLLYQGLDPNANGDYSQLPYRLGLATQTNNSC